MPTTLHFRAETITPLVIAGAENRSPDVLDEGLRPPSLRGVMRWWFRAMMGGIVGAHGDYKTLRDLEGAVFGVTDQGSSVRIRTYPLNSVKPDKAYLCMNDQRSKKSGAPKDYDKIQKPSIAPNGQVIIQLEGQSRAEANLALCSLWLTAMLGGVGNRSRRGFGSLALSPKDDDTVKAMHPLSLDFSYPDMPLSEIATRLADRLKQTHGYFKSYAPSIGSPSPAKFPVLSQTQAKLWLIKPQAGFWTSWQEAMNNLRDNIYRPCKRHLGLTAIGSANPRFASPLIVQIKRTVAGEYFGILLAFDHSWHQRKFWSSWGQLDTFLESLSNYEYQGVALP